MEQYGNPPVFPSKEELAAEEEKKAEEKKKANVDPLKFRAAKVTFSYFFLIFFFSFLIVVFVRRKWRKSKAKALFNGKSCNNWDSLMKKSQDLLTRTIGSNTSLLLQRFFFDLFFESQIVLMMFETGGYHFNGL